MFLVLLVAVLLVGCVEVWRHSIWRNVSSKDTIELYEIFLKRYPKGEFSDEARSRLDELYLEKAKITNTIESYEEFLRRDPNEKLADDTRKSMDFLKDQIRDLEEVARNALPSRATVKVTSESLYPMGPNFVITYSDYLSSYVIGDNVTHEGLTRAIRYRCAGILGSISSKKKIPRGSNIIIKVELWISGNLLPQSRMVNIYSITISVETMREREISSMRRESIMDLWSVNRDIIPSLKFKKSVRPF